MTNNVSIVDLVPNRCAKCLQHFFDSPMIVEAFASVGISYGKSSGQMAKSFYAGYHKRGHREPTHATVR